jgi:hypothetical protein
MSATAMTRMAVWTERASDTFDLPRDATLRIPRRGGTAIIRVERGVVLVTRAGDLEDHVLERGMELRVSEPGLVVAWALEPSTVRVGEAARRRAAYSAGRGARC